MSRHSWNGTRGNSAFCNLITLVAVCSVRSIRSVAVDNQLAAINRRIEVQIPRINAKPAFGQQEIAEHDSWTLEAVGDVEDLGNDLEAVSNVERSADHSRIIAESCAEHLPQIALLGLCGNARRRSCALAVNHHHRSLHHRGHTEPFAHQRESAA